jgi:uncharacterized membrane protein (DUF485 family)
MADVIPRDGQSEGAGAQDGQAPDWQRIERSPEFRELTRRRHRFLAAASVVFLGWFLTYLLFATFAPGIMGTLIGGVPFAFYAAVSQVLMTWAVTWVYLRKADREFAPLEQRVLEEAGARFTRDGDAAARTSPAARPTTGRAAR